MRPDSITPDSDRTRDGRAHISDAVCRRNGLRSGRRVAVLGASNVPTRLQLQVSDMATTATTPRRRVPNVSTPLLERAHQRHGMAAYHAQVMRQVENGDTRLGGRTRPARVVRIIVGSFGDLDAAGFSEHERWREHMLAELRDADHTSSADASWIVTRLESDLLRVTALLGHAYGTPDLGNKPDPVDELVYIILSRRTREGAYQAAYEALKSRDFDAGRSSPRHRYADRGADQLLGSRPAQGPEPEARAWRL